MHQSVLMQQFMFLRCLPETKKVTAFYPVSDSSHLKILKMAPVNLTGGSETELAIMKCYKISGELLDIVF